MYYGWVGGYLNARRDASDSASQAESAARRAENATARLEDQLQRQALIIRSLLEMCSKKGLFNTDEFRELVTEIDLSDGKLDGKYKPMAGPRNCPNCGKVNGKTAMTCMYCQAALPDRELM